MFTYWIVSCSIEGNYLAVTYFQYNFTLFNVLVSVDPSIVMGVVFKSYFSCITSSLVDVVVEITILIIL